MAWTDYSSTPANAWDSSIGSVTSDDKLTVQPGDEATFGVVSADIEAPLTVVNLLAGSYNIPGFDDGYQPSGVNDPINGDLGGGNGGGGGGPTRPTSGFLYPRGQA